MIKKLIILLADKLNYAIVKKDKLINGVWLQKLNIGLIFDIGANEGQFALRINKILPKAKIIAFEPIGSVYTTLKKNLEYLNAEILNLGVGDKIGEVEINISNANASSSIMEMEELHAKTFNHTEYVGKEKIKITTLDNMLEKVKEPVNVLLKIDVQGYEKYVLNEAQEFITKVDIILIESTFKPLYTNQWLFIDTINYLDKKGFIFLGFLEQHESPLTQIPIYSDSIFVRKEKTDNLYVK